VDELRDLALQSPDLAIPVKETEMEIVAMATLQEVMTW
jgi:hypothetical protein